MLQTLSNVDDFIKDFTTNDYFIATKEKFAIYDPIFREYVKVGTIFPKKDTEDSEE